MFNTYLWIIEKWYIEESRLTWRDYKWEVPFLISTSTSTILTHVRWGVVTDRHFLCPDILLPVGILLSYSVLLVRIRIAKCFTNETVSTRSNVREWTRVLLFNTPYLFLYVLCTTGVSSGLATRVTLTRVSRGVWRVYYTGWTCFCCHFCSAIRDCFGSV
jgi:hypothetical protein